MAIGHQVGLVLAGAACGCVGWWLGANSVAGTILPQIVPPNIVGRLESIDSSLKDVQARLSGIRNIQPGQVERTSDQSSAGGTEAIAASLKDLRSLVDSLRVDVAQSNDLIRSGLPQLAKNPGAVESAYAAEKSDPGAVRRRHFCWTQSQVYLAYGLPDVTGNSGGNPFWGYSIDEDNGLFFIFSSGVVDMVTRNPPVSRPFHHENVGDGR